MGFGDFQLNNNGKKEVLQNTKNGVRKEQVDKKFHNLFDAYDANKDGTLETNELNEIFNGLSSFAGDDKVLDTAENQLARSVFAEKTDIQNADFMGFVESVSTASADIIETKEKQTSDGGKEVTTTYNDGTTETIAFYSNGDYKWKKTEKKFTETTYEMVYNGQKRQLNESEFKKVLAKIEEKKNAKTQKNSLEGKSFKMPASESVSAFANTTKKVEKKEVYSPRYIAETLGVNTETEDGKKVVERLSQLPQEILEKLKDGKELKELIASQELEPTFDNISNVLEITEGVTLRNEEEYKSTEAQRQEILTQIKAANFMANLYETLADYNDQYTDSVGLFGLGSEGIGYVLNKLGLDGENHYQFADSCREWAKNASELKVLNPQKFKEGFKNIYGKTADKYGIDYNSDAFKKCFALAESGKAFDKDNKMTDEYKETILKAMNIVANDPNDSTFNQVMNGFGEALIMIISFGLGAEIKAGAKLATTTMGILSKAGVAIASKQVNNKLLQGALRFSGQAVKLVGPALNEGAKMYLYTATEGTLANVSSRAIKQDGFDKLLDTQTQVMTNAEGSFTFGAFAGVFGSTVTQKVMQRASKVASKVTTALSEKFSKGAVNANEVFATILEKSAPTKIAEVAAFATDVVGFTAFESALSIANTLQREGTLTPEKLADTLMEEFGHQGYSLGQIKVISHLIMMLTGSRSARIQSQKYLQENLPQLKGATVELVNGSKDGFKINLPDGRKIECKNSAEMISSLQLMVRGETAFSSKFDKEDKNTKKEFKAGIEKVDNTPQPDPQTKENFDNMIARLKNGHVNYTLSTTEDGRNLVKIENSTKLFTANRFDYYEFDKNGNLVKSQTQISEASAKEMFTAFKNAQTRNIRNRGGRLNAGVPVMDMAEGIEANATSRNVRNEVGNTEIQAFDRKYADTLLSIELGISDSEKAEILELAKIDKEFVNELLASKKGHKDYKPVYFRDEAVMNKLDGKTTETKFEQKADYDRVSNEYTVEDMRFLVEAKNIDENMTRELMSAILDGARRFTPEQINKIVKLSQADKEFANELIHATTTNYKNSKEYLYPPTYISIILKNLPTLKNFKSEILNAESSILLRAFVIDPEYTKELVNSQRFNPVQIVEIVKNGNGNGYNKALLKDLINSTKQNDDNSQVATFKAYEIIKILDFEKNIDEKDIDAKDILSFYEYLSKSSLNLCDVLESKQVSAYKKAYKYLKEHNIETAKIEFIDIETEDINRNIKINIDDNLNLAKNWNVAFFDKQCNFIRADVATKAENRRTENIKTDTRNVEFQTETQKSVEVENRDMLINSLKKISDSNGKLLYTEKYETSSDVANKFDIIREYTDGKKYKIGLAEVSNAGDIIIEKTLVSETGVKTDYNYLETPNGSILSNTQITDKNGNVIFNNNYQYKVIDDNHYSTVENGVKYDIQFKENEVTVTRSDGKSVSISLGNNSVNSSDAVLSKDLLPILKQMPASFYFDMKEYGLKKIGLEIDNVGENNAHYNSEKKLIAVSKGDSDATFILAHEFGHYRDEFLKVSSDPDVIKTYMKERKALIENQSQFETVQLDYFIKVRTVGISRSIEEITAEINAFLYASNIKSDIELRGQYLQQYFPETFAKIADKLTNRNKGKVEITMNNSVAASHVYNAQEPVKKYVKPETKVDLTPEGIVKNTIKKEQNSLQDNNIKMQYAPEISHFEFYATLEELRSENGINGVKISSTYRSMLRHKGIAIIDNEKEIIKIEKANGQYRICVQKKEIKPSKTTTEKTEKAIAYKSAIIAYCFSPMYKEINKSAEKTGKDVAPEIKEISDNLEELIDLQPCMQKLENKVYRKEYTSWIVEEIQKMLNSKNIEDITPDDNIKIIQPHFLSTSQIDNGGFAIAKDSDIKVKYELDVEAGCKAIDIIDYFGTDYFAENESFANKVMQDRELLFQKGTAIKISSVKKDPNGYWIIKGTLSPN